MRANIELALTPVQEWTEKERARFTGEINELFQTCSETLDLLAEDASDQVGSNLETDAESKKNDSER